MNIMYDYQIFTEQNYGGISRYFSELIKLFSNDKGFKISFASLVSNNYYLSMCGVRQKMLFPKIPVKGKQKLIRSINMKYAKLLLSRNDFDIFHPTYYDPYFMNYLNNKPYIITVYDLINEICIEPNLYSEKQKSERQELLGKASHIISISENTKNDIVSYYGINPCKITTVYLGNSLFINNTKKCLLKLPPKYFLFVGKRNGYKNFNNFISSIADFLKEYKMSLVCAGGNNPDKEEIKLLNELKIENEVVFYPQIQDYDLVHLYKNAAAFIFPSKYEGFGIPILEAFACGCPVIVSNSSSLPEVAGDAAIYFDPNSSASIKSSVNKYFDIGFNKVELISKGYKQLSKFSWINTYLNTSEVYKSII